ncbi:HU family DNA-binding protein [Rickettsiales bacterium]|nr:HU family DNA-binding protein [Rickettsiales bacterium]
MNKEQLTSAIASKVGSTQKDAAAFVDAFIEAVSDSLSSGDSVQLAGFGSLSVKERKATTGRNPRTGEEIKIAAKKVVKLSVAKKLKEAVNN